MTTQIHKYHPRDTEEQLYDVPLHDVELNDVTNVRHKSASSCVPRWLRIFHPGKRGMKVVHPRVDPQWKIGGCSNNGNLVFLPTLSAHPGVLYNAGRFVWIISSVRSSNSHPNLLLTHQHHHPLFQITPVLNTGLSLSEPLQLYKGYNAI